VTLSTKEIRTMIDDVRGAVNTTVMATELARKRSTLARAGRRHRRRVPADRGARGDDDRCCARDRALDEAATTAVEQVNIAITNVAQTTRETEASATPDAADFGAADELSTELSAARPDGEA